MPDYNALIKLSTFFGVSSDFLLGKEDDLGIKTYSKSCTANYKGYPALYPLSEKGVNMDNFVKKLKDLRLEKNLNQKELAQKIGYTNSTICDWEKGRSEPSLEALNKLADFFDVSVDYLMGREEDIKGYEPAEERSRAAEPLSGEEAELLQDFRQLGVFARSSILIQVKALAEKAKKEELKQK